MDAANLSGRQPIRSRPASGDEKASPGVSESDSVKLAARLATVGIFLLLFGTFLYFAKSLLVPIISAAVVSATLGPASASATRYKIPSPIFAIACVGAIAVIITILMMIVANTTAEVVARGPEIAAALKAKLEILARPLATMQGIYDTVVPQSGAPTAQLKFDLPVDALLAPVAAFLTPAVGEILLFIVTLVFFLLSRSRQRQFLITFFDSRKLKLGILRSLTEIEQNFAYYLGAMTLVNFGVGATVAAIVYFTGMPGPVVIGASAFFLNYIPYVGPAIVATILFAVGIITFPTLTDAILAPGLFTAVAIIEGHFVTPSIMGRHLTVSPLAVFLSLAFWTWLWGPIGTFLATPFLIAVMMVHEHIFAPNTAQLPD